MNLAQTVSRSLELQREFGILEADLAGVAVLLAIRCLACKHTVYMRVDANTVEPKFDRRFRLAFVIAAPNESASPIPALPVFF